MNKILLVFLIICISLNANAINVTYNFYEGNITYEGLLVKSLKPVNNVGVLGFECLDRDCSRLGSKIIDKNSGNNQITTLTYPESQSRFGYAVYYFKNGFIPWESNPTWFGPDSETRGPFDIYLAKKEICTGFITNFSVVNSEKPFMPLQVSVTTELNASTLSGIRSAGPLQAVPNELSQHYKIRQLMRLIVTDENNTMLSDQTQREFLNYSSSKTFNFTYTPTKSGQFNLKLQSRVIDPKCLNTPDIFSSKTVAVYQEEPTNMCYTLLNNVNINSYSVRPGDTLIISGKKISNKIN